MTAYLPPYHLGEPLTMEEFVMVNELYGSGIDPEDPAVIARLDQYNQSKLDKEHDPA